MTADKESKGMSVLAGLTAQVMGEKMTAATPKRKLTPVEGEVGRIPAKVPDVPGDFLTDEGLEMTARNLRRMATDLRQQADGLEKVAEGIDRIREHTADYTPEDREAKRKQNEFEADLRAKERAAQAATFAPEPESEVEDENQPEDTSVDAATTPSDGVTPAASPASGWLCPDHGKAVEKTGKNGTYIGCPDCNKFAR